MQSKMQLLTWNYGGDIFLPSDTNVAGHCTKCKANLETRRTVFQSILMTASTLHFVRRLFQNVRNQVFKHVFFLEKVETHQISLGYLHINACCT